MNINPGQDKPIFIQIAEGIEDGILTGAFPYLQLSFLGEETPIQVAWRFDNQVMYELE